MPTGPGFWSSTSNGSGPKNGKLPYPYPLLASELIFGEGNEVTETVFEDLKKRVQELSFKSSELAIKYAKKAAVFYGVPGIVLYCNTIYQDLVKDKENIGLIYQDARTVLVYLLLAEKLMTTYECERSDMQKLLPDEEISNPNYWEDKKKALSTLVNMPNEEINNCKSESEYLFESVTGTKFENGSVDVFVK